MYDPLHQPAPVRSNPNVGTIILAAPMSFVGAYQRTRPLIRSYSNVAVTVLALVGVALLLLLWWAAVVSWYWILITFTLGGFVVYRIIRRGQRRKDAVARTQIRALQQGSHPVPPEWQQ